MMLNRIVFVSLAMVAAAATAAPAATKYSANLVPNTYNDPPPNPTLSTKSSVKLSDKGTVTISLAGVTDPSGNLVTTSTTWNDTQTTDGSEYVALVKLYLPAIWLQPPNIPYVELPVVLDLKAGKGKKTISVGGLIGFLGPGNGRGIEIQGTQVWGPLGAAAANCEATVEGGIPVVFPGDTTTCRGGPGRRCVGGPNAGAVCTVDSECPTGACTTFNLGMSGLYIPNP